LAVCRLLLRVDVVGVVLLFLGSLEVVAGALPDIGVVVVGRRTVAGRTFLLI
jgi:hypothetical protein